MKWVSLSCAALLVGASACSSEANSADESEAGVEQFSINVEADRSRILEQEEDLQKQQQSVETEKEKLERARREISDRLANLSKSDRKQRAALESEQKQLAQQENELRDRLQRFERQRSKLEQEKDDLLARIGQMSESSGNISGLQSSVRAQSRRIEELEKTIEQDNQRLSAKMDRIEKLLVEALEKSGGTRTVVVERGGGSSSKRATASEVDAARRTYRRAMKSKRFLVSDLSPAARRTLSDAEDATKEKDFEQALGHYQTLVSSVSNTRVDAEFIDAKAKRADRLVRQGSIPTQKVQPILQKIGEAAADGRYGMANIHLNQIFALAGRN